MKRRFFGALLLFSLLVCASAGIFYLSRGGERTDHAGHIIALNEIEQLAKSGNTELVSEKAAVLQESLRQSGEAQNGGRGILMLGGICLLILALSFGYIYIRIIRPFDRMKGFAGRIARGDFDLPLDYGRSDYFGEFTWAFDSMRTEITKARACEREAIDNNKTVIATLSHDIKTPVSSIRAYAEGLEANLDGTPEKRARYLSVIIRKCDEVSRLTNDLFLHSLSDLDKLKITPEKTALCSFAESAVSEISGERGDVRFARPGFEAFVMADKNRLMQIAENLINNARKYAKTTVDIFVTREDGYVNLHFRDYGDGIPDEDMPFIYDKFYRGSNCGGEQGSGLGLYIVKYLTVQMNGKFALRNRLDGLEATVGLPEII